MRVIGYITSLFCSAWPLIAESSGELPRHFMFGPGPAAPGVTAVTPEMSYSKERGFGFEPGDGTHHNNFGAYELAKCIVTGIRANLPALAKLLAADAPAFDPAQPDTLEKFDVPASPQSTNVKPDGN